MHFIEFLFLVYLLFEYLLANVLSDVEQQLEEELA